MAEKRPHNYWSTKPRTTHHNPKVSGVSLHRYTPVTTTIPTTAKSHRYQVYFSKVLACNDNNYNTLKFCGYKQTQAMYTHQRGGGEHQKL